VSRVETLRPVHDKQRAVRIRVYQGESRFTSENVLLAELEVPVRKRPATEEQLHVRFTYDVSGVLEVEAEVESTGERHRALLENSAGSLTPAEIQTRFASLAALKVHPRHDAPNVYAINRAKRLFEELLGDDRELVGHLLDTFFAVLNKQDRELAAEARGEMMARLDELEGPTGR
jgi:molecular chaperone HscC